MIGFVLAALAGLLCWAGLFLLIGGPVLLVLLGIVFLLIGFAIFASLYERAERKLEVPTGHTRIGIDR
jgi:uncharacterized membrane protein